MASAYVPKNRQQARVALVEEHIQHENQHDLEGVLATFGNSAHYDDEAWGEHHKGIDGVRSFYEQLMAALPDVQNRRSEATRHGRRNHCGSDNSRHASGHVARPSGDRAPG